MDRPADGAAREVRRLAREGRWQGTTRGAAPGRVQCNVLALRGADAQAFAQWCELNRAVAPVIARTRAGSALLPDLGEDVDLSRDLPAYQLFAHGRPGAVVPDLVESWTADTTGFAFGCSFSLEDALRAGGIPLDYESRGFGGAIYVTRRDTVPHGGFAGPLVVSMRPIRADLVQACIDLCARFPRLHGAPVHAGDPDALGIRLGEPLQSIGNLSIAAGEVPVFWACGVTTHDLLAQARPAWAASHVSAQMLVTDLPVAAMEEAYGHEAVQHR